MRPANRKIGRGWRNDALFRFAMGVAHECDSEPELLAKAQVFAAESFTLELAEDEVGRIVGSAWRYTIRGENHVGRPYAQLRHEDIDALANMPDALILYTVLKRHNALRDEFLIANAMAKVTVPYNVKRLSNARRQLIELGFVIEMRRPSSLYGPAIYAWPS